MRELFACTAAAFGEETPPLGGQSFEQGLALYARFTRDRAERAIEEGEDLALLGGRLYRNAYRLGQQARRWFRLSTKAEELAAARLLYRIVGIDFRCTEEGEVTVRRCYFSRVYSAAVCRLISFLDSGVLAGLSGGGRLTFTQRITEGEACCRATFAREEDGP